MEFKTASTDGCPAEHLLKTLSGKWKPQIFRIALEGPIRFNLLLRQIEGSNKQSISVALRELEEQELLEKVIIKQKPLHIEYNLSEKGKSLIPIFRQLEFLSHEQVLN
ncbi:MULTISPECIES: winged helix-turn-helix transcriptional regulator [Arcicella]|uniref:Winged helix-turn-helix transcriptional regulator n=1 Tax=Arcicella lustrica TaxID=2984196 RepID=A0ABU5SPH5_9BACT|nr:winged helix-turn-helix transcriptional regulator [Arcicella sp. DC25W]MEA5429158.1 winged helix-turn-helix transcriptional regulator [Arcicella sp. DC25W]